MGALFAVVPKTAAAAVEDKGLIVWQANVKRDGILGRPVWQRPDGSTVPITAIGYTRNNGLADFYGPDVVIPPSSPFYDC